MAKADMLAKKAEDERKKQEQEARKAQEAALRHQKEAARAAMKEAEKNSKAAQEFRYKQATASQSRENAAAQAAAESNKTTRLGMVADYFGQGAKQSAVNVGQAIGALGRTFTNDAQTQQMVPYLGMNEDLQAENAKAKEARSAYNADAAQKAVATARQLATQQQALDTKYAGKNTAADWLLKTGAQGVGGMVPTIVGSAIPGVGAAAGIIASVLQGMGGGYTDALEDGANEGNAMANAMLQGAIAGGVEKLVGGVPGFKQAGGWLDDAVEGAVGKLGSKAAQGAARWGLNAAGEGLEEVAEEALGEAAARIAYGKRGSIEQTLAGKKTVPELMSEYGQTFAGGALVGGLMDAAGNVVRGAMGTQRAPKAQASAGTDARQSTQGAASQPTQGQNAQVPELRTKAAKAAPQLVPELEEATSVDDNPQTHTPEEQVKIAEYKEAVDPDMAEYVDRVRGGEKLKPYTVTQANDRARQAMLDLTGLQKVGEYVVLDENGVNHITKRHGGGNGSADGTMKESADVARAKYVLDNFDEAYLSTDNADGYVTADGKLAPIVIFSKKIDGTHIVVEAVCDTKKNRNFIVSQYLSSVGADQTKIAKAWHSSMDAGKTSPRDTSETLDATTFANSNIAGVADVVKADASVPELEKTGQTYEPVPGLGDLPENAVGATKAKGETYTDSQTNSIRAAARDAGVTDPDMEADIAEHMHVVRGVADADKAAQAILKKHGTTRAANLLMRHAERAGGWDADDATLAWHTLQAMVKRLNSGSASLDKPKMVDGKDSGMTVREDLIMRMNALSAAYADQNTKAGQYLGYLGSKVKELNAANVLRDVQGVVQDAVNRRVENGGGRKKTEQTEKALKIAEQQADEKWLMLVNGKAEHEGGTGRTGKRQTKKVTIWNFDAYREVQAALDELGYKMRDLVTEYSETQRSINGAVINTIVAKNARSEAEARNILEDSVNAFLDLRMDAIQRNLERLFPELRNTNPNESRKSKTAFEKFVDVVNMGQYSRRDIKELVASHYGISPLNNAQTMEIVQLAEQMEKLNRNSKAYAQKKDRVVEILAEALGPTSWSESVSSLSYVMMLSNILKTGGKNVIGNTSSGVLYRLKNTVVKPALEKALRATKLGDKLDYTYTTGKVDDALRREAYKVYTDEAYGLVNGPSKYDTTGRLNLEKSGTPKEILEGEVKAARKKYAGKAGKLGDAVQWLADAENETYAAQDELGAIGTAELLNHLPKGSKIAQRIGSWAESRAQAGKGGLGGTQNNFVDALARAMKANGIKTAAELDADPERKEELLRHAVQQAKEVTFHDENALSRKAQVISKDLGWLGRSTMPFARTPANVAMRAVEYSPIGTLIAGGKAWQGDANAAVDALAKSLTGSALMALGLAAGSLGYLSGGSGDERKDRYEQSTKGEQDYSLNIGKLMQDIGIDAPDATISVETLSPAILPMLVGASLAKDEDGARNWGDALLSVADPMIDMTFLSGLSDLISDIQSASDPNQAPGNIVVSVFTGVLGQYVPSVLRQAGNARNQYRQSYYSDEDTTRKRMADQAVKSATGWIPFLGDDQTIDYVDQWGRKQENAGGSFAGRLAYNMLSPAYYAEGKSTKVDAELEGLYADLLDAGYTEREADKVYPTAGIYYEDYNVKTNGKERRMTAAEMEQFAPVKGQTSYELVETLTGSSQYNRLTAEAKADLVAKMYSFAKAHAYSDAVNGYKMTAANAKVEAMYDAYGAKGVVDYYMAKTNAGTDGNDSLSTGELIPYLEKQSYSDAEKAAIFSQLMTVKGVGATNVRGAYGEEGVYDLYAAKHYADVNNNGSVTAEEAKAYLDRQAFDRAYKAALYDAMVTGKKNPYK